MPTLWAIIVIVKLATEPFTLSFQTERGFITQDDCKAALKALKATPTFKPYKAFCVGPEQRMR